MAEVITVRLQTGVVPDMLITQSLSFHGTFQALGYYWRAELRYERFAPGVSFAVLFDPLTAPSRPEDLRVRDAKEFVATVRLLDRGTGAVQVTSRDVSFKGASGGCFFPNMCPVRTYSRIVVSMPHPILLDQGEHSVDATITIKEIKGRGSSVPVIPPTPRRQAVREMFDRGSLTDVTVVVEDTKFSASAFILAGQSDVFEAMLSNKQWKEGKERILRVGGIKPKTMSLLLGYMHQHGVPEDISLEDLVALMLAADRYNIRGLMETCEAFLQKPRELGVLADGYQPLLDAFVFASKVSKPAIMEAVMKLIKGPARDITTSDEFQHFLANHPGEAASMFRLLNSQSI